MDLWVVFTLTLLVSVTSAQVFERMCTEGEARLGVYLKPHETMCSLYYQCDVNMSGTLMACPEGLLFDANYRTCTNPEYATCGNANIRCDVNDFNSAWPTYCCDRYIGCNNGKLYHGSCEVTTVFNEESGQCVADGACNSHSKCLRLATKVNTNTHMASCDKRAVEDECKYRQLDQAGNDRGIQWCAEGTSFNATMCNCGIHNKNCMRTSIANNRAPDTQCRATMTLDFSTRRPSSYSMKTANGQKVANLYAIGAKGYTPANTEGIFATTPTGEKAYLYFWTYAQNMLKGPFGIKVTFMANNPQEGYSFSVISNDMVSSRPDCQGTLDIKAAYSRGQWTITFVAVGKNVVTGQTTKATQVQTVPSTRGNEYITVSFIFSKADKNIFGYVKSQGSNAIAWGPQMVYGDRIDINNCGLRVAHGLEGRLRELVFYEACSNIDMLRSAMQ